MNWTKANYSYLSYNSHNLYEASYYKFGEELECSIYDFFDGKFKAFISRLNNQYDMFEEVFSETYSSLRAAKRGIERFIKNRYKIEWKKKNDYVYEAAYKDYRFCVSSWLPVRFITVYTEIAGHTFLTNIFMEKRKELEEVTKEVEEFLEEAYK